MQKYSIKATISINLILTILCISIMGCGESESKKEERIHLEKTKKNKAKFYYPISHDKWWRWYEPNLIGAEGWIISKCGDNDYPEVRMTVIQNDISHKSWGRYEGTLLVGNLNEEKSFKIDIKCFQPDYNKGVWLNTTE